MNVFWFGFDWTAGPDCELYWLLGLWFCVQAGQVVIALGKGAPKSHCLFTDSKVSVHWSWKTQQKESKSFGGKQRWETFLLSPLNNILTPVWSCTIGDLFSHVRTDREVHLSVPSSPLTLVNGCMLVTCLPITLGSSNISSVLHCLCLTGYLTYMRSLLP